MDHIYNEKTIYQISQIRPFGVRETEKLLPYFYEAEAEWIIPMLTPGLYKTIAADVSAYEDVMYAYYYAADTAFHEGLSKAAAYLTYSRFVRNKDITVTEAGLRLKSADLSSGVEDKDVQRIANDSERIGMKYLQHVRDYCVFKGYLTIKEGEKTPNKQRIKIIGD